MREQHHWRAQLQRDDGQMVEYPLSVYWDPDAEDAAEAVARTAACEAYYKSGGSPETRRKFAPISAHRLETAA